MASMLSGDTANQRQTKSAVHDRTHLVIAFLVEVAVLGRCQGDQGHGRSPEAAELTQDLAGELASNRDVTNHETVCMGAQRHRHTCLAP